MRLTILEGSTFCICDEIGDLDGHTSGLFADDTRFLSRLELRVNGERPLLLSSGKVEYYSAAFYLRNPVVEGLPQDALAIARERFVGEGMQDHLLLQNVGGAPLSFELDLEVGNDFADIISVKEHDFALGNPLTAPPLPGPAAVRFDAASNQLVLEERSGSAKTQVLLSRPGEVEGSTVRFRLDLAPRELWELRVDVVPSLSGEESQPHVVERRFGEEREHVRESLDAWHLSVPRLRSAGDDLRQAFAQSVSDLAALRMRGGDGIGMLPAAGMPWFMTVFGRDTIITSLQTMLLGPELAIASLDALAALQAREDDASIDAEPGKILHELRRGRAAETWFGTYYGSVDATPLFLVLLSEVWRWTGDAELVERLREPAFAALGWIDEHGDRDGDGFVEYERRTPRGLENQSWKDSGDSQRFHDGSFARTPIAPAEVQGYVYDAKLRLAELAREVWADVPLAERLEREAGELRERFHTAYWVGARGGFYALALDGEKRAVDSACSNLGHLLWSGIVPPERRQAVADRLTGHGLWSGWGIRTMSTADAAYNPLSYHNGTVWPHDTSLGAWGLARAGRSADTQRIALTLLEAARFFGWSLPEVFAGFEKGSTPFPIAYPTAARPQAWAAGTPVLLLRLILGLEPDPGARQLRGNTENAPAWADGLELDGVRAFGKPWNVRVADGRVTVTGVKIAVLSPVWFPVPPSGYGGIEWIVSLLADGLADAGHDVTLFASGDSRTRAKLDAVFETAPSERIGQTFWELQHALQCFARHDDFDIIHDHTGLMGLALGGLLSTPLVHTVHGPVSGHPGDLYEQVVHMAPGARLVSLSMSQREPRPQLPWIANVPNALDLSFYPYLRERGDYLLFLGRMSPDKGAHRAVAIALETGLPLKIAGKCAEPAEQAYFDEYVGPHLGGDREYVGEVTHGEKVELLQHARATLFPISWEEPFGLVMIESMACGTPVIATRYGAVPEVVDHGRTGIIVREWREMEDVLEAADALDSDVMRREVEQRFTPERMVADYLAAYEAALSS